MRRHVDREKLEAFMREIGRRAASPGTIYLTGGATALLLGVRQQTVDIDIKLDPEPRGVFEAIAELKVALGVNVELAAPDQFIPALPGWRERSAPIAHFGKVEFRHYDYYSQALAKIERSHEKDIADARAFVEAGLVEPTELHRLADVVRAELPRYPAIDPADFERKLSAFLLAYGI